MGKEHEITDFLSLLPPPLHEVPNGLECRAKEKEKRRMLQIRLYLHGSTVPMNEWGDQSRVVFMKYEWPPRERERSNAIERKCRSLKSTVKMGKIVAKDVPRLDDNLSDEEKNHGRLTPWGQTPVNWSVEACSSKVFLSANTFRSINQNWWSIDTPLTHTLTHTLTRSQLQESVRCFSSICFQFLPFILYSSINRWIALNIVSLLEHRVVIDQHHRHWSHTSLSTPFTHIMVLWMWCCALWWYLSHISTIHTKQSSSSSILVVFSLLLLLISEKFLQKW